MGKEEGEVILVDIWASIFGMRVRIALAEKGIPYEYKEDNVRNKSQLLLDMNPVHKKVPILIHNGKPICESKIIVEYIDDVWNDKALLLPSDAYAKAQARFWADYADTKLYEIARMLYRTRGKEHEETRKEFIDCLKVIEGELGDKPYFGGESFGYLDVSLIPFSAWFQVYETYGKLSIEKECPKLTAWVKRCFQNKESVSKVLPDTSKVYHHIETRCIRWGIPNLYVS